MSRSTELVRKLYAAHPAERYRLEWVMTQQQYDTLENDYRLLRGRDWTPPGYTPASLVPQLYGLPIRIDPTAGDIHLERRTNT